MKKEITFDEALANYGQAHKELIAAQNKEAKVQLEIINKRKAFTLAREQLQAVERDSRIY